MKISTKGRYALRLMLDLALNGDGASYVTIKSVAARQGISEKYLEQIVPHLSRAGFLKSVRGAQGGYMLAKATQEYTVGDILRLVEGNLAPVACLTPGAGQCPREDGCATLEVWKKLSGAIDTVVDSFTLADLVRIEQEKQTLHPELAHMAGVGCIGLGGKKP